MKTVPLQEVLLCPRPDKRIALTTIARDRPRTNLKILTIRTEGTKKVATHPLLQITRELSPGYLPTASSVEVTGIMRENSALL